MLNIYAALRPLPLLTLTATVALLSRPAFGDGNSYQTRSYSAKTLGTTTGAAVGAGNPANTQQVNTTADVTILGHTLNALTANVDSPSVLSPSDLTTTTPSTGTTDPGCTTTDCVDIGGTSYTTVYSFGKAVFANAFSITSSGPNNIKIGLAPTEVRVPFVLYAVGPLVLEVAGGVRFQANLNATLAPEIAIPLSDSGLTVQLQALAEAGGFVEAYAVLLIIRGGVGGQVDLINGQLNVNGQLLFNALNNPAILINGMVQFFNGRFYAFLDIFGFLTLGWKRLIDHTLYSWTGICYSMGALQCPAN